MVSGQPVADITADSLKIDEVGQKCLEEFKTRMVSDKSNAFFYPIAKNKRPTFATSEKKAKLKNTAKEEVRIEKDVLGTLRTADGNRRETKKSDLFSVLDDMEIDINDAHERCKTYMVDLAAHVRSVIKQCTTVTDIVDKLLASIPSRYETVYVVCDTYLKGSIKSAERQTRGDGNRCILKNPDMKVPYDIDCFLSVGKNKEHLFNLLKMVLIEVTRDFTIYFCFRDCVEIKQNVKSMRPDLHCDHEEADAMLVAYASLVNSGGVMVGSPTRDIDIVTLFLYHAMSFDANIFTDNGTGSQRKVLKINSCGLSDEKRSAIIELLAFMHSLGMIIYPVYFGRERRHAGKKCVRRLIMLPFFHRLAAHT